MRKSIAFGLFSFILISLLVFAGISLGKDQGAENLRMYQLPHIAPREPNLFPEREMEVVLKTPITMGQCAPCHENLDNFKVENLRGVNHAKHLARGIACASCHYFNPHTPDGVLRIPMDICFNCHGLVHGPSGELASGDCKTCHYEKKRPSDHTPDWLSKKHATASVDRCVMCHRDIAYCNDCHKREGLRLIEEREYAFRFYEPPKTQLAVRVKIGIPEKMGDCYPCHRDIERFEVEGLIFKHEPHFRQGIRCASCHLFYPHQPDKTYRIPMDVCYACHQVTHGPQGVIAPANCNLCHPVWFYTKKPPDHTARFVAGQHSERASKDPAYCAMCHADSFCQKCHLERRIIPDDHRDQQKWMKEHGKDRKTLTGCDACHPKKYCNDCHRVEPIPHPAQYLAEHGKSKIPDSKACNLCHKDRTFCESCHHFEVANALLKKENCVKCHPEYNIPRFIEIKNRGHMVHAAHFEMTNTPPFTCDKCHALGYTLGHDYATFQLCKECHGAYRLGKLIAKWNVDNGELCVRCHRPGTGLSTNVKVTPP